MRSASSGVTSNVTTVLGTGLPSFACSWSYLVPAVSTWTLLTTTREWLCCSRWPESVTTRSTRVPGTTKPATPITSFTFTEMARMPAVIVGGSPPPASLAATFVAVIGSFSATGVMTPRSTSSSTVLKPPATGLLAGQATSFTSLALSKVPTASGLFATAT